MHRLATKPVRSRRIEWPADLTLSHNRLGRGLVVFLGLSTLVFVALALVFAVGPWIWPDDLGGPARRQTIGTAVGFAVFALIEALALYDARNYRITIRGRTLTAGGALFRKSIDLNAAAAWSEMSTKVHFVPIASYLRLHDGEGKVLVMLYTQMEGFSALSELIKAGLPSAGRHEASRERADLAEASVNAELQGEQPLQIGRITAIETGASVMIIASSITIAGLGYYGLLVEYADLTRWIVITYAIGLATGCGVFLARPLPISPFAGHRHFNLGAAMTIGAMSLWLGAAMGPAQLQLAKLSGYGAAAGIMLAMAGVWRMRLATAKAARFAQLLVLIAAPGAVPIHLNYSLDRSGPRILTSTVTTKHSYDSRRGAGPRFKIDYANPLRPTSDKELMVDEATFARLEIGSQIRLRVRRGFFRSPWVEGLEPP